MHRSWFRTKFQEKKTEVTTKVVSAVKTGVSTQVNRFKSDTPKPKDECMICGKKMKPKDGQVSDGRVCSPACAHTYVKSL